MVDGRHRRSEIERVSGDLMWKVEYVTASNRAEAVWFDDLYELQVMLSNQHVAAAAMKLNRWLRTSAQVPSLQSQWHVREFADWIMTDEGASPGLGAK